MWAPVKSIRATLVASSKIRRVIKSRIGKISTSSKNDRPENRASSIKMRALRTKCSKNDHGPDPSNVPMNLRCLLFQRISLAFIFVVIGLEDPLARRIQQSTFENGTIESGSVTERWRRRNWHNCRTSAPSKLAPAPKATPVNVIHQTQLPKIVFVKLASSPKSAPVKFGRRLRRSRQRRWANHRRLRQ